MGTKDNLLSFKVGQMAEARSFLTGYRGAWFRCKIKEIGLRRGQIAYALEYFDFPDEKIKWTQIYQKSPIQKIKSNKIKRELMVRPPFPQVYHESQMEHLSMITEETVIVNDVWKVGDLVDWLTDGCYWCGTVSQLLSDDKVQIQLPQPPLGEGLSYDVYTKDLRPSLDWSPEHGWTVPVSTDGEEHCPCAQLIKPLKHDKHNAQATNGTLDRFGSFSSHISTSSLPPPDKSIHSLATESKAHAQEANMELDMEDGISSSTFRDASATVSEKDQYYNGEASKNISSRTIPLNSERDDTIEAAILDLEELANKVRWLKGILKCGTLTNDTRPLWKFVEHCAPSLPK